MDFSAIKVKTKGPVTTVSLNRPEVHNAFNEKMIAEITECFESIHENEEIRVVIISGEGKSFCAGADLEWMKSMAGYTHEENIEDAKSLEKMLSSVYNCSKATIAKVQGAAMGGGAGLACTCDIVIASQDAKFSFSEVKLGLAPSVISPFVIKKIGPGRSRALFVTAERFNSDTAQRIGLVHQITPTEDLNAQVDVLTSLLLLNGPHAIAASKELVDIVSGLSPEEAADFTTELIASLRVSEEGQEGIKSFLEKRRPSFGAVNE